MVCVTCNKNQKNETKKNKKLCRTVNKERNILGVLCGMCNDTCKRWEMK